MARAPGKVRLYAPSLVVLAVLLPFFAYYVRQVKAQEGYLNAHAFRVLEVAAKQFAAQFKGARDTMVASIQVGIERCQRDPHLSEKERLACEEGAANIGQTAKQQAEHYLHTYLVDLADRDSPSYADRVPCLLKGETLTLIRREGISPSAIKLEIRRPMMDASANQPIDSKDCADPKPPPAYQIQASLNPVRLLKRAVGRDGATVFDAVILATEDGAVIAQTENASALVRDMESLLAGRRTKREVEEGKTDREAANPPVTSVTPGEAVNAATRLAGVEERVVVEVSGETYFLFSVPLPVSVELKQIGAETQSTELVLYGLARKEAWEARAMHLPSLSVPAVILLLIMGMALLWPVLQLQTMSPKERLRQSTVWLMAGSSLLAAVLVAVIFLVTGFYVRLDHRLNQEKDGQLETLSKQIQAHFAWETVQAIRTSRLAIDYLTKGGSQPPAPGFAGLSSLLKDQKDARATNLHEALLSYPHFAHIILTSRLGNKNSPIPTGVERQIYKISLDQVPTPLIALPPAQFPFVDRLLNGHYATLHHKYPAGTATSHPFTLESLVSPNTGEFLPAMMFYPSENTATENPNGLNNRDYRVLIATKLPSLVNVVLPRGFGFAVVNDDGLVLFHSDTTRNLRENFYGECDAPAKLREAVANRSPESLSMLYGGRTVSAFVQPLGGNDVKEKSGQKMSAAGPDPSVSNLDVSLIVFHESAVNTGLYTALGRGFLYWTAFVPAVLFVLFVFWDQLRRTLSPSSRARYSSKRPWPANRDKQFYLLEGVWGISWFLFAFAVWVLYPVDSRGSSLLPVLAKVPLILYSLALLAGAVGVSLSLRRHRWVTWICERDWLQPWLMAWKERIPLSAAFSLRLFSCVLVVLGPLSFIIFHLLLSDLQRHEQDRDVGAAANAMEARRERNIGNWSGSSAAAETCQPGENNDCKAYWGFGKAQTDGMGYFDVYDRAACPQEVQVGRGVERVAPEIADSLKEGASPTDRDLSHKGVAAAGPCAQSPRLPWWRVSFSSFNRRGMLFHFLALLGIALLFLWKHFLIRRLFILDFRPPKPLQRADANWLGSAMGTALSSASPALRRTLIFTHPRSGTGDALRQILEGLASQKLISAQFSLLDCPSLLGGRPEDDGGWRKKIIDKHASSRLVILDNFATGLMNEADRKDKLALLERLVFAKKPHVYVITSLDPLLVLQSLIGQRPADLGLRQEVDRWARVLSAFERVALQEWQAVPAMGVAVAALKKSLNQAPLLTPEERIECRAMFRFELSGSTFLRRCAAKVDLQKLDLSTPRHFEQSLVTQVRAVTEGYYRIVWLNCTGDERLALFQLAKDGWMNPLNKAGIAHVIRKKLVGQAARTTSGLKDGAYQLMNESFRQFVLEAVEEREATEWAAERSQSLWPSMRIALMLAAGLVVLFIAYTRRDLFDVYFSYFAALAGGSAALFRIVVQLFKKDDSTLAAALGVGKAEKGEG